MVSYNTLDKELRGKLNDLTSDEVMSILDSNVKNIYDAFFIYDLENMKKYKDELEHTQKILESKFNNVRGYSLERMLFYETSISHVRLRWFLLEQLRKETESYVYLYGHLETLFFHLVDVLDIYYWNYSNYSFLTDLFGDLAIKERLPITFPLNDRYVFGEYGTNDRLMRMLDDLIGEIRDEILDIMERIEKNQYSPDENPQEWEEVFDMYKSHVHEIIEEEQYSYQKEKGIIDVELGFIPIHQIRMDVHEAYGELKKEIEELFEGDNGFNRIRKFFIESFLERNPDGNVEEELKHYPKYNIMKTKLIPPEFNLCEEIYGDRWYIMKTPHHLSRWDYYYHDFSDLEGGD